jgi:hypothetical protein
VGVEVGVARLHRVEDVGEIALDLLEGQHTAQIARPAELAARQQVEELLVVLDRLKKIVALELLLIRAEIDLDHQERAGLLGPARGDSRAAWIVAQAHLQSGRVSGPRSPSLLLHSLHR